MARQADGNVTGLSKSAERVSLSSHHAGEPAAAHAHKLRGLDAMRFYAASMIVLFHLVHLPRLEIPAYMEVIRDQFGIGVPLFYVVSAFGLAFGYFGKLDGGSEIREYFERRVWRIAPLFYVLIFVSILIQYFLFNISHGFFEVLASFMFFFNIIPKYTTGFVWASWSIGVEMVFYVFLPVLLIAVRGFPMACVFWAICSVTAGYWNTSFAVAPQELKSFGTYFIVPHLPNFAAGLLAYFVFLWIRDRYADFGQKHTGQGLVIIGLAAFCLILLQASAIVAVVGSTAYLAIRSLVLALLVVGISLYAMPYMAGNLAVMLGKTSFSLYLWHPIVIAALHRIGVYKLAFALVPEAGLAFLACATVTFAVLIPFSLLSYHFVEKPGMRMAGRPFSWQTLARTFGDPWIMTVRRFVTGRP